MSTTTLLIAPRLTRDMAGWRRAWSILASRVGDVSAHADDGERWQYMGTEGGWHVFRHRSFRGGRAYERVAVKRGDFERWS